ncbi:putative salicylate hydroxylase [Xylariaceae sp. FL0594]|nr:putative salicylate hydroxylase [Xylariaceae sp. FL0594]
MDQHGKDALLPQRRAVRPLSVIVVGAGIGGLATALAMRKAGHDVVILERRQAISEVGAGIQLAPNAARVLGRFGVLDEAMRYATVLEGVSLRRWESGEELDLVPMVPDVEARFGAPVAAMHRADMLRVLLDAVVAAGCEVLTGHTVVDIDEQFLPLAAIPVERFPVPDTPGILVHSSDRKQIWMHADLVLAADGVNSLIRRRMALASEAGNISSQHAHQPTTAQLAYRFLLPRELLLSLTAGHDEGGGPSSLVEETLDKNQGIRVMGPGGHVMAYPLRNNTLYNVVLVRETPRDGDANGDDSAIVTTSSTPSWTTSASKEKVLEHYRGWCPLVRKLIESAPRSGILRTPMSDMPPLQTWAMGRVALVGDACHYMFPYVAQGAANAIEDAGVLAMAFTCTDDVELALDIYQMVRKERGERIQNSAKETGRSVHLPDGEEQEKRDEAIRLAGKGLGNNPDQWNDRNFRDFMWGVDAWRRRSTCLYDTNKMISEERGTGTSSGRNLFASGFTA